ncbi:hypothetical protein [Teredinibacter haidensis]|uniref:hypothetical protein n=1 Tax=Teredinibacter haidensis TaxID=2731755 RepID=UPI000948D5A0|nr:hypothetical protein [Teredinibacter haidensis]
MKLWCKDQQGVAERVTPLRRLGLVTAAAVLSFSAAEGYTAEPSEEAESPPLLPSEELLLFIAEFNEVDDETFNLLMERGKQDARQQKAASAKEQPEVEATKGTEHD